MITFYVDNTGNIEYTIKFNLVSGKNVQRFLVMGKVGSTKNPFERFLHVLALRLEELSEEFENTIKTKRIYTVNRYTDEKGNLFREIKDFPLDEFYRIEL